MSKLKDYDIMDIEAFDDDEDWNRLCVKYNKLIELKKDFCEKFNDIELEIDK